MVRQGAFSHLKEHLFGLVISPSSVGDSWIITHYPWDLSKFHKLFSTRFSFISELLSITDLTGFLVHSLTPGFQEGKSH